VVGLALDGRGLTSAAPDPDDELLAFAGAVVATLWLTAIVEHRLTGVWESHGAASGEWLTIGALFLAYLCVAAACANYASRVRHAFYGLLVRLSGSPRRLQRTLVAFGAAAGMAAVVGILILLYVPAWTAGGLVAIAGIAIWYTLAFAHGRLLQSAAAKLGRTRDVVRGVGIASDAGSVVRALYRTAFVAILLATTAWLVVDAHRSVALAIGLAQGLMLKRVGAPARFGFGKATAVVASSMVAWVFAAGFTYTPVAEWLLGATKTTAVSGIIFAAVLALVVTELYAAGRFEPGASRRSRALIMVFAVVCFAVLALRTNDLYADWVPYHRSYWVGPADFVRQGAWLLWDFPSQYGFLSALSLAVWPSASTWQALYEQTAITLVFDASILFALLRYGRRGMVNVAFSLLASITMFFSSLSSRHPFGWRLYPQVGLRFTGLIALLGITFLLYVWRHDARRRRMAYALGFVVWTVSVLWSFESGALVTLVWLSFVVLDLTLELLTRPAPAFEILHKSINRLLPLVLIPACVVAVLNLLYRAHVGHAPDWRAYAEFAFAYSTGDPSRQAIQVRGPGWMLVTCLIACGAVTVRAVWKGAFESLPLLIACWLALWGVCNYYVAEGFGNHANGIAPIVAMVFAILLALHRGQRGRELVTLPVRALIAPLLVLVIAQGFSWPSFPTSVLPPSFSNRPLDSLSHAPVVHGELAALLHAAKVRDSELIVYPVSIWDTKADSALIFPFVRSGTGFVTQQYAWLPLSPIGPYNELNTLSPDRARLYINRYYRHVHATGWLVSYHRRVDCGRLIPSLRTTNVYRSVNFQIARCR